MPADYLHLLNCICLFDVKQDKECWNEGSVMVVGATKLTADSWSSIIDDVYNRPTKKRPYYYIHNQNDIYLDSSTFAPTDRNGQLPTNINNTAATVASGNATDILETVDITTTPATSIGFDRTFDFDADGDSIITPSEKHSTIEKPAGSRHANSSKVRVEIRCGRDNSNVFDLSAVQIDYVKAPQFIRLTQEQLDSDEDISQIMEFPDYVNQEIINELVNLIMRRINDPSLNTHL